MIFFNEVGNLDGLIAFLVGIMIGPPIVLVIIGLMLLNKHKTAAKVLFILATVYLLVSLGICGVLMGGG